MNLQNPYHLELALVAAVLVDAATLRIPEVRALRPHHLRHLGGVWRVIRELHDAGVEPSLTELAPHVGGQGWPAGFTLADLIGVQAYSVRPHELPGAASGILAEYRRVHGNAVGADLQKALLNPEADHLAAIGGAHAALADLLGTTPRDGTASIADDLDAAIDRILNPTRHRGVTSGLPGLDAVTGGWQPGTLNILAARPSMGKSLLMGQFGQAAALGGASAPVRALMFSLEDGAVVTRMRALARMSSVPIQHDAAPHPSALPRIEAARQRLEGLRDRWLIDEEATLDGIVATCWRQHAVAPLGLVLIDQLSHVLADAPRSKADNRTQLYGHITKTLKREVAQRLGVPVLLASQLSREAVKGSDPRPQLTHLRDSGELEQDADTVTFIHRPEYYDPEDSPGVAELIVSKNRNGPTRTVQAQANMKLFKFWQDQP